ncbi:hypothetical protein [Treponema sp.]|uniref:hypothetical protein n=1 Tax=Treponema sp. TaxID=166 RepID=UPI00298E7518|nr:hypothetical protein [Treponema sp.]MCR5612480.1 hypothetical protein [Treponema sp.]
MQKKIATLPKHTVVYEISIQEALTELAAAKIEIESMQQQLVSFPCKALHFTKFFS